MIAGLIAELGPWSWWLLGFVLLIAEIAVPGVFLVWIGIAAILIGAVSLLHWGSPWWSWEVQWLSFAVLAVLSALVGRQIVTSRGSTSDQPHLNRRGDSLVGRTAILEEAIAEGRGRIRLDDTTWMVSGPDLPPGTRVRITAYTGRDLSVERA